MTTIAYKDGILACDSQVTENHMALHRINKIQKIAPKQYIAFCGNPIAALKFIDHIKGGKDISSGQLPEETYLIYANNGKLFYIDEGLFPDEISLYKPYANGSGCQIAMGAMMAGASALEAVRIACKLDPHSSAPIYSVNINE